MKGREVTTFGNRFDKFLAERAKKARDETIKAFVLAEKNLASSRLPTEPSFNGGCANISFGHFFVTAT